MSVSGDVADAVKAAVEALALPGVTVVRRKTPGVPEGTAAGLPQVVVSVGEEGATEYLTSRDKVRTYPVAVTVVTAGGAKAADDPLVRAWRDRIDAAVDRKGAFAAVVGFVQVDVGGGPPFDAGALAKDFNYSVQTFRVTVSEDRT